MSKIAVFETEQDKRLWLEEVEAVSDMILTFGYELHEAYDDVTVSDLQGMASAVAMRVVKLIRDKE